MWTGWIKHVALSVWTVPRAGLPQGGMPRSPLPSSCLLLPQVRMDALLMRQYELLACFEGKGSQAGRSISMSKGGITKGVAWGARSVWHDHHGLPTACISQHALTCTTGLHACTA